MMSCRTDLESEFKVKRNGWISIRCLQKSQEKLTIFTMIYGTIRWTSEDKLIYKNESKAHDYQGRKLTKKNEKKGTNGSKVRVLSS